jgi:hypothetical protein
VEAISAQAVFEPVRVCPEVRNGTLTQPAAFTNSALGSGASTRAFALVPRGTPRRITEDGIVVSAPNTAVRTRRSNVHSQCPQRIDCPDCLGAFIGYTGAIADGRANDLVPLRSICRTRP